LLRLVLLLWGAAPGVGATFWGWGLWVGWACVGTVGWLGVCGHSGVAGRAWAQRPLMIAGGCGVLPARGHGGCISPRASHSLEQVPGEGRASPGGQCQVVRVQRRAQPRAAAHRLIGPHSPTQPHLSGLCGVPGRRPGRGWWSRPLECLRRQRHGAWGALLVM